MAFKITLNYFNCVKFETRQRYIRNIMIWWKSLWFIGEVIPYRRITRVRYPVGALGSFRHHHVQIGVKKNITSHNISEGEGGRDMKLTAAPIKCLFKDLIEKDELDTCCTLTYWEVFLLFSSSVSGNIQGDSKRWIQFRTAIFPELYIICGWSTYNSKEGVLKFQIPPL
jgi:hypothetical protein